MGRETKILLGLLGMLGFVFLGALLARLFVARPPVGLGVDIHANVAVSEPEAVVEPPELGHPGRSAFTAVKTAATGGSEPSAVVPAAFEEPAAFERTVAFKEETVEGPRPRNPEIVPSRAIRQGAGFTVMEGDSWWNLAEAAYGDGRWYRGLYAWNRAIDSSVSLRPGTRLVVPTTAELAAAYPGLVPARGSSGSER